MSTHLSNIEGMEMAGKLPEVRLANTPFKVVSPFEPSGDQPEAIAIEQLFFTNNKTTGIMVAQARGVILLAARKKGVPTYEYTPMQVKQSVVGYGKAVKKQVMEMTRIMLRLEKIPKPDDAADALAIAICHGHSACSYMGRSRLEEAIARSDAREARRMAEIERKKLEQRG